MPWANITLCDWCTQEKQSEIKAGLAQILLELMNKQEQGLVVTFTTPFAFYRAGALAKDAAIVDLKYIGEFPLSVKQAVTRRVAEMIAQALPVDPKKVTVLMTEVKSENWGRNAGDYS